MVADPVPSPAETPAEAPKGPTVIGQDDLIYSLGKAHAMLDARERIDAQQAELIAEFTRENGRLHERIRELEAELATKQVAREITTRKRR